MERKTVFITGAGGFLGRQLLTYYLQREDRDFVLLEHPSFLERLSTWAASMPNGRRIRVLEGDITQPGLGISAPLKDELKATVTHAIHLAALYNLSAPRDVSVRVNVDGTRNLLDFLHECPRLERFAHTSTLAVAGDYSGVFSEEDFDKGQRHKNFYEETKFLSEKLVREHSATLPTVILRPAVVVGDSQTGYIEKIDGAVLHVRHGLAQSALDRAQRRKNLVPYRAR